MTNLFGRAARVVAGTLGTTWQIHTVGDPHLESARRTGSFIYALWHRAVLPLLWHHRGEPATLVVSQHRDAQILVDCAVAWGFTVIRGSSTRGGQDVLRALLAVLERGGRVAVTPDGPRGPAGVVKPGIVVAAARSGVPILPVAARTSRAWTLGSWDRFVIPKPFATVEVEYGELLRIGKQPRARAWDARTLATRLGPA